MSARTFILGCVLLITEEPTVNVIFRTTIKTLYLYFVNSLIVSFTVNRLSEVVFRVVWNLLNISGVYFSLIPLWTYCS